MPPEVERLALLVLGLIGESIVFRLVGRRALTGLAGGQGAVRRRPRGGRCRRGDRTPGGSTATPRRRRRQGRAPRRPRRHRRPTRSRPGRLRPPSPHPWIRGRRARGSGLRIFFLLFLAM